MIRTDGHHYDQDGYLVDAEGSLIYFVQEMKGERRVKIGRTKSMRARFPQLQTGSPEPLEVIHTEPGGAAREAYFHRLWAPFRYRKNGEWFVAARAILRYVARAPAGRRGRTPMSPRAIPWAKILRPLGVTPRGAVRLLVGLLMLLHPKKRKRKSVQRRAWISLPTLGGSWMAHLQYGPPALWGIIPVVVAACFLAGRE